MSDCHMSNHHAAHLLRTLQENGFVVQEDAAARLVQQQQEKELPLYLNIMIAIGVFLSAQCFLFFLFLADLIDTAHEKTIIGLGLCFTIAAFGLFHMARRAGMVMHSMLIHASFTTMTMGKALCVIGVGVMFESGWVVSLALLLVTLLTYYTYRMAIDRFLSSFIVLFSVLLNIVLNPDTEAIRELLFNGFFVLQCVIVAVLTAYNRIKRDTIPLIYALLFSLCMMVLYVASQKAWVGGFIIQIQNIISPLVITLVLSMSLIALFGWAAGGITQYKKTDIWLACIGAIILGTVSASGILLAIGLMVLGYAKHERPMMCIGMLFIPVFLWVYYYSLDVTLLRKSAILMGSGVLLLIGWAYLHYKTKKEGEVPCVPS